MKRAGRAVEPRPAPKARIAAHPQERQHSAAEGGTRDRVRPAGALHMRRSRRTTLRARHPNGRRRGWRWWPFTEGVRGSGRHASRARPEGDARKSLPF